MSGWLDGPLTGYDLETTGPIPETARIVSASLITVGRGVERVDRSWLVKVDEEIPAAAVEVHHITTEYARAHGEPLAVVVAELLGALVDAWKAGPVVAFNASFDFTVLAAEVLRLELPPLDLGPILDPMVLDRETARYRSGKRTLARVAEVYGVANDNPHSSDADALTAARIAYALGRRHARIGQTPAADLHRLQVHWAAEQRQSFEKWKREHGDPDFVCDPGWPITEAFQKGVTRGE